MRLLFDENLSPRLAQGMQEAFPGSTHVHLVGLGGGSDRDVWEYAKIHGYTLVSKDADFNEMGQLRGYPPKIIWLKRGNATTATLLRIFQEQSAAILAFEQHEAAVLILY